MARANNRIFRIRICTSDGDGLKWFKISIDTSTKLKNGFLDRTKRKSKLPREGLSWTKSESARKTTFGKNKNKRIRDNYFVFGRKTNTF